MTQEPCKKCGEYHNNCYEFSELTGGYEVLDMNKYDVTVRMTVSDWEAILNYGSPQILIEELEGYKEKSDTYMELMDVHAKELDRAIELLHRCETEMRYAGWTKFESDNSARNGVYEQVKEFLK